MSDGNTREIQANASLNDSGSASAHDRLLADVQSSTSNSKPSDQQKVSDQSQSASGSDTITVQPNQLIANAQSAAQEISGYFQNGYDPARSFKFKMPVARLLK